ncbi:MAG: hypothetical protein AVDCRST_MAG66-1084 [uncultured Pseudonocardia sp.]|uniref:Uncharacterized protein n=1 Tax=uncultured Pseudonocardia sp. TaxID=211455 RepID=A0A6J4NSB8_9PSEU|nr:MAG: hypothetical protein AVDCRST_MAG66-1084 [uncultured Pseudonocardia sp.]
MCTHPIDRLADARPAHGYVERRPLRPDTSRDVGSRSA